MQTSSLLWGSTLLLLCLPAAAQTRPQPPPKRTWWKTSLITLAAATAADAHSSFGRFETNPLLRGHNGQFNGKGFAIKAAITGGALGVQALLLRGRPEADKYAAAANFAMAGLFTGAAVHNHGVKKAPDLPR